MKKSELKQLIRETIEEIESNKPVSYEDALIKVASAQSDADYHHNMQGGSGARSLSSVEILSAIFGVNWKKVESDLEKVK